MKLFHERGVSNQRQFQYLLNSLFQLTSQKISPHKWLLMQKAHRRETGGDFTRSIWSSSCHPQTKSQRINPSGETSVNLKPHESIWWRSNRQYMIFIDNNCELGYAHIQQIGISSEPGMIRFEFRIQVSCLILDISESLWHYSDVIMGVIVSEITSLTTVYSTVYSDAD